MKDKTSNRILYHYCSTNTAYEILKSKTLRMSDITKSNDYDEIYSFFPGILDAIADKYKEDEFELLYRNRKNRDALSLLLEMEYNYIDDLFKGGGLTSFVVCFCEEGNLLSQWRGYADDAKGCSIGFSEKEINELCIKENNLFTLAKVKYKTSKQLSVIIANSAKKILKGLRDIRNVIERDLEVFVRNGKTDDIIALIFHKWVCKFIINSLQYKNYAYKEEREWRLFFNCNVKEQVDLVFSDEKIDTLFNDDLIKKLRNRIDFKVTNNNIIPFFPVELFELSKNPIKEIYLGPENRIREKDFELLCAKFGYKNIRLKCSSISYRS